MRDDMARILTSCITHKEKTALSSRWILSCALPMLFSSAVLADVYPPAPGTDRESAAFQDAAEKYLLALDLDDPALEFERLGGTTSTNWSVRRGGMPVANLKCSRGNTNHHGAVVAYRLGKLLGFNIYPVAVYRSVDATIAGRHFREQCVLKSWSSVFTQYYWTRETFTDPDARRKSALTAALRCDQARPVETERFQYVASSKFGDPRLPGRDRVLYRGESSLLSAARDFSSMMVVDALIGNEDRFPGGNTFFRSVNTSFLRDGNSVVFENARLYSLDNEATFKSKHASTSHSAADLRRFVSRFDDRVVAALAKLSKEPEVLADITDNDDAMSEFILEGIRFVLETYGEAQNRCGSSAAMF